MDWASSLLKRSSNPPFKKRMSLEHARAAAMSPKVAAVRFARATALCKKCNITGGEYIFSLDESGVSLRGMALGGREKCIAQAGTRPNARELKLRGQKGRASFMPVTNGVGGAYTPLVVLHGESLLVVVGLAK